jgi:hypothetical protein
MHSLAIEIHLLAAAARDNWLQAESVAITLRCSCSSDNYLQHSRRQVAVMVVVALESARLACILRLSHVYERKSTLVKGSTHEKSIKLISTNHIKDEDEGKQFVMLTL